MRWDGQTLGAPDGSLPGLERAGLVRSVSTPHFAGMVFHEVMAKSALSRVRGDFLPFSWTVNPYRGCSHACTYCFARASHRYLDLDTGHGFDTQIVVKTNIAQVLAAELSRRSWQRDQVALGTNTDPYQRAEGRYRLMPGIITALADANTPVSILTKGTLLRRDLPLLAATAERVSVSLGVSLAVLDEELRRVVEPGAPSPSARLDLIRAIRKAGLSCSVMVAPVLPWLTDSTAHLTGLLDAIKDAGASEASFIPLHLRPGAREWFMAWLSRRRPDLVPGYKRIYATGSYASKPYRLWLADRVRPLLTARGLGPANLRSGHAGTSGRPEGFTSSPGNSSGTSLGVALDQTLF